MNPYSGLVLEHVHDEMGNPLQINGLDDMRRKEKHYKFRSLVANENSCDFDKPPQKKAVDLMEAMDESGGWGDNREACNHLVKEMRLAGELC